MMQSILQKLALFIGMGAIFVTVSEFWFYEVGEEVGHIGILLAYSVLAYVFVTCVVYFKLHTFAGLFVAASLFGILTESVAVPVLFTAMPFTIIWTSLAWHALITVMIFWYAYLYILELSRPLIKVVYLLLMGAGLGLWNSFMWNVSAIDDVTGDISYAWVDPSEFILQLLLGYALFIGGHLLFAYGSSKPISFGRNEMWILFAVISGFFVIGPGITMFPFSLVLLPLVFVCWKAFVRQYDRSATPAFFSGFLAKSFRK